MDLVRTAVTVLIIFLWSSLSGLADASDVCKVVAGYCPVAEAKAQQDCFCNTVFGVLQGRAQSRPDGDTTTDLLEQVRRTSITASALTLQVFGVEAGRTDLSQWLSSIDPNVSVIYAKSKNSKALAISEIDAVWFTSDIPEAVVRLCVITLLEGGIAIRSVESYVVDAGEGRPLRRNTIQLGRSVRNRNIKPLSSRQVLQDPMPLPGAR